MGASKNARAGFSRRRETSSAPRDRHVAESGLDGPSRAGTVSDDEAHASHREDLQTLSDPPACTA